MVSILLAILKFLGILMLVILGILLAVLFLVLFVPVRYKLTACRKVTEDVPIVAEVKVTWLLHILNVAFSYPKAAYVRVRLFCFTVFKTGQFFGAASRSGTEKERTEEQKVKEKKTEAQKAEQKAKEKKTEVQKTEEQQEIPENQQAEENTEKESAETKSTETGETESGERESVWRKAGRFFRKLLELLGNIRYTITGIYDKIRHVVNNIRYYIKIIKSDTFSSAWTVCSGQVFSLLKSIGPREVSGTLLIGTGDPASTGEVMAAYGILYPFIGNHIDIIPDFEQQIVEGDLLVKGKITVFKALKTAWILYFNRDLRRLIKLFKREAA